MKIGLTGASGFVGTALQDVFNDTVSIHRNDDENTILKKLQDVDVVINLAGAPIVKRWTPEYKKVLFSSRIDTTRTLVNAINKSDVKHFISTSAIGAYPDNSAYDESFNGYGNDFLASLTQAWEEEAMRCEKTTAILRFGVVLGKGGALAKMLPPFKLGLGGVIGDGKMVTSWIDIDDLMTIYGFVIDKKLSGLYNAVSPQPITNEVLTKTLAEILNRPSFLPLPEFALQMIYGEGASVLTGSKEIYPKALLDEGFQFQYQNIRASLEHILK